MQSSSAYHFKTIPNVRRGSRTWPPVRGECLQQRPEQFLPLNLGYVNLLVLPVCIMFGEGGKSTSNLSLLHILVTLNQ